MEKIKGYCVRCRKMQEMKDVAMAVLKSGMSAAKGACVKCGCRMCKIVGKAKGGKK